MYRVMKQSRYRYLILLPLMLLLWALLYAGRLAASAQSLVAQGWNQAFYSSFPAVMGPNYQGSYDPNLVPLSSFAPPGLHLPPGLLTGYPVTPLSGDEPGVSLVTVTKSFSPPSIPGDGATLSILTFTVTNPAGNPKQFGLNFTDTLPSGVTVLGPTALSCPLLNTSVGPNTITVTGYIDPGPETCTLQYFVESDTPGTYTNSTSNLSNVSSNLDVSGVNAILTVTVPPTPFTGYDQGDITPIPKHITPPMQITTCQTSKFAAVSGLPYGPLTVTWSGVAGATQYTVIAEGNGVPSWTPPTKELGTTTVQVPTTKATVTLTAADVHDLLNAKGQFIIVVVAQKPGSDSDVSPLCIITHYIGAVPPLPTNTPRPPATPTERWLPPPPNNSGPSCLPPNHWFGNPPKCIPS